MEDARLSFRLLVGTAVLVAAIACFAAWQLWQAREARLAQAETEARNLVGTLEQHAVRTIEAVDLMLQGIVDRLEAPRAAPPDAAGMYRELAGESERLPQIAALLVFDERGKLLYDSVTAERRNLDAADQTFFKIHRRGDVGLYISPPEATAITGSRGAILSRRFTRSDDSFAGVVVASLRLSYFQSFYDRIDIGPGGTIALWHADGALMVRKPAFAPDALPGASRPGFVEQLLMAPAGQYRTDSPATDAVDRMVSYSRVGLALPLVITVARARADILAPWRQQVWLDGGVALGLTVLLGLVGTRLGRALARLGDNERRARSAETRLRDAIESLPDGFLLWDAEDRLVMVNPAMQRAEAQRNVPPDAALTLGRSFAELVRRRIEQRVVAVLPAEMEGLIESRLARHRAATGEPHEERYADGRCYRVTERRTSDGGVVTILADVTEVKRAEAEMRDANHRLETQARSLAEAAERLQAANRQAEAALSAAEESNRSKSEFLTTMSHELRTPLTAVLGFSDVIINPIFGAETPEQFREYGGYIKASGEHLLLLINDMLDLAKIEAGKMELRDSEASLEQIVQSVLAMTKERAHEQGVSVTWQPPEQPLALRVDEIRIKQALINVVSNAIKFTPAGGRIAITVELGPELIDIRVADTGIGIKPEDIPKVFEPYRQIDSEVARRHKGTGLGMPLTFNLMRLHGGTVLLESALGVGTTVTLRLPASRVLRRLARAS